MRILLSSIYPYVFLLLYLTIPFDEYVRALPNILLIILVAAFPLIVNKSDFRKLKRTPTLIFLGFCIALAANMLLTDRIDQNFDVVKMVGISLGLVILYIPIQDFKKIHKAIMFSSLAAIAFSFVMMVYLVNTSSGMPLGSSQDMLDILLIDRLYLGLLCVLSILVSFQELQDKFHPKNKYLIANIVLTVLFLLFIVSTIAIVILIVMLILRQFYGQKKGRRIVFVIGSSALVMTLIFIASDTFTERFLFDEGYVENTSLLEERRIGEPRLTIWECAENISISEGIMMAGLGFNETNSRL